MADDRYEAYCTMYTLSQIRETLSKMNTYDQAEYVYDCIQKALASNNAKTVQAVITQVSHKVQNNDE